MPSLVLIGPAVRPAISNIQTDRHIAFYYVDNIFICISDSCTQVNYKNDCALVAHMFSYLFICVHMGLAA